MIAIRHAITLAQAADHGIGDALNLLRLMSEPVDANTFRFLLEVFSAASRFIAPPPAGCSHGHEVSTAMSLFQHSDESFNLGMRAVVAQFASLQVRNGAAYVTRLGMLPDLWDLAEDLFAEFLLPCVEPGTLRISDALVKAAARARIEVHSDGICFDLQDVLLHARQEANR